MMTFDLYFAQALGLVVHVVDCLGMTQHGVQKDADTSEMASQGFFAIKSFCQHYQTITNS